MWAWSSFSKPSISPSSSLLAAFEKGLNTSIPPFFLLPFLTVSESHRGAWTCAWMTALAGLCHQWSGPGPKVLIQNQSARFHFCHSRSSLPPTVRLQKSGGGHIRNARLRMVDRCAERRWGGGMPVLNKLRYLASYPACLVPRRGRISRESRVSAVTVPRTLGSAAGGAGVRLWVSLLWEFYVFELVTGSLA